MGKMKIRLFPDGTIQMETEGIKGKRCTDYAKVLAKKRQWTMFPLKLPMAKFMALLGIMAQAKLLLSRHAQA